MDELDRILFSGGGTQTTTQAKPTNDGLDAILSGSGQATTQPQASGLELPEQGLPQKSAISLLKRMQLSFADDNGREAYLRKQFPEVMKLPNGKFAVGDGKGNIAPIDPEGIFNDVLGDLADITAAIPTIAGQIAGAVAGAPGGPGGIVAGGAVGAAGGEAISRGIGKALGVDIRNADEQAVDVAVSGAFGGLGEGIGQAIKFTGKGLAKVATRSLDKALKGSPEPSKSLQALAKVFKVTANVNERDTMTAGMYGFDNTLGPKYSNPNLVRSLTTDLVEGVTDRNKALREAVDVGDKWAKGKFGNNSVELRQIGVQLLNDLSDPSVGIMDASGKLNPGAFTEAADYKTIKELTNLFFSKNPVTGQLNPRNLSVSQAIDYRKRMNTSISNYFKSRRVNPKAETAIADYMSNIRNAVAKEVKVEGLDDTLNPYLKANKEFSSWKKDLGLMKENGLDLEDVTGLKDYVRVVDGKKQILSRSIQEFAEKLETKNPAVQDSFRIIANQLDNKYVGGGINGSVGTLYDELAKWNAAQGFKNSNPSLLRLGAIAGLTGISLSSGDPESAVKRLGIGLLIGTPAGAKILLRTGGKAKGAMQINALRKAVKGKHVDVNLLRALLSQAAAGSVKKDVNKNQGNQNNRNILK